MKKILAISGSLRSASANAAILRAMAAMMPEGVHYKIWEGIGALPHFSPDIEAGGLPGPVLAYQRALAAADAVIICTPEYAFGMPGVLKNALDWTVSWGALDRKPVGRISASPLPSGGAKAHAWLSQTLTALGARQTDDTSLIIPAIKARLDERGELRDAATLEDLQQVVSAIIAQAAAPAGWE